MDFGQYDLSDAEKAEIQAGIAKLFEPRGIFNSTHGKALVIKHISNIGPITDVTFQTPRYQFKMLCAGVEEILDLQAYYTGRTIPEEYVYQPHNIKFAISTLRSKLLEAAGVAE